MVGKPVPLSKHHVRKKVADLMFADRSLSVASYLYDANAGVIVRRVVVDFYPVR